VDAAVVFRLIVSQSPGSHLIILPQRSVLGQRLQRRPRYLTGSPSLVHTPPLEQFEQQPHLEPGPCCYPSISPALLGQRYPAEVCRSLRL
jgi:hypothetical protein